MSFDLTLQRFASQIAYALLVPSWVGFIHCYYDRLPSTIVGDRVVEALEFGIIPMGTLACSLITFVASLPAIKNEPDQRSSWVFCLTCAIPFFGMLSLLDSGGASPILLR